MIIQTIRDISQRRQVLSVVFALLPVALAAVLIATYYWPSSPPEWPAAFYIDEETGKITTRASNELPPLIGESGKPTVVRAIYLTPSDIGHKFVAYYEKYTDEAIARVKAVASTSAIGAPPPVRGGILIRRPDAGSLWLNADSAEGQKLLEAIYNPPGRKESGSGPLRLCPP